ncbi:MAG: lipoyl synthase [Mucinivorans sp.]
MQDAHGKAQRKPQWLKVKLHNTQGFAEVASIVGQHGLHTICSSGKCPNISECWSARTATFMIAGEICTRSCKFCATLSGRPLPLDTNEPIKVARSIKLMGLRHAVVTSVDRDDLVDGGANHWVSTVEAIRQQSPTTTIELLIPDFDGREDLLELIVAVGADIVGHNIETVERLTSSTRSRATYATSLKALEYLALRGVQTKSGLMVGLGETFDEVLTTLRDLYNVGVRRATIGQYLQPTKNHLEVVEYITPQTFELYRVAALEMGYTHMFSAPMVRSSYMAEL